VNIILIKDIVIDILLINSSYFLGKHYGKYDNECESVTKKKKHLFFIIIFFNEKNLLLAQKYTT
jgi:hypothetical protein